MIATAAAVAFVVYSCKGKIAVTDTKNIGDIPVQTVDDMFIVQTNNGKIQMRAEAPLMERYESDSLSYELFPEGFHVYGYTDEEKLETVVITSKTAIICVKILRIRPPLFYTFLYIITCIACCVKC